MAKTDFFYDNNAMRCTETTASKNISDTNLGTNLYLFFPPEIAPDLESGSFDS